MLLLFFQNKLHGLCHIMSSTRAPFRVSVDCSFNLLEMVFDAMRRGSNATTGASFISHFFRRLPRMSLARNQTFFTPRTTFGKGQFRWRCDSNACRAAVMFNYCHQRQGNKSPSYPVACPKSNNPTIPSPSRPKIASSNYVTEGTAHY